MIFEYDFEKSKINKQKQGIDFEETKALWVVDNVILPAVTRGEERYIIIGKIKLNLYSCIFTVRKKNIRMISCRRSREKERKIYHEKINE